jgi:YHS domain-containing protein
VNTTAEGVAISGYDPISYREGAPVRGSTDHAARYGGASYWFASEAHRATFESNPAKYAPSFGGFCGYAASIGVIAPIDPMIYLVQNDRLILQHTANALELYEKDPLGSLKRADQNWPELVARAGL